MKKIILISMILIALIFLTGCGLYDLGNFILPDDSEFMNVVEALDTPQKIGDYMLENFEYEAHVFTAQNPHELFLSQKGDCDEFSTFGTFIANYHNYETYQLRIYYKNFKHRIAIYVEDNYYSITNNQYYSFGYDTFLEIVKTDSKSRDKIWTKYFVYDYWDDTIETGYNN